MSKCQTYVSNDPPSRLPCWCRARHRQCSSLRFNPADGRPSGIDDASARHTSGSYAMMAKIMTARTKLTRESRGSILAPSRQCRTALPPFAPRANGARIWPAPTGHGIERNPHTAQFVVRQPRASVGTFMNCEPRDLSRRIVLRIMRRGEDAFTRGIPLPWSD
jgi:hypothetical protein